MSNLIGRIIYDPAVERRTYVTGETWEAGQINATLDYIQTLEDCMSRPKDQDQDEPATPPGIRTRTFGWTGPLDVRELRSWIDQLPNNAMLDVIGPGSTGIGQIEAVWEV